jgi:molybdopterin synthase sulfur carrier subunit
MNCRVLYFARLRERFGVGEEALQFDAAPSVADLIAQLRQRGGAWYDELAPDKVFRVAVNQELAALDAPIPDDAEVAIFPPVTGG